MPVSITKSTVAEAVIAKIVKNAFGENPKQIEELTEGYFNTAYQISLQEKQVILKIAPSPETDIMTYEKNIMFSEVDAMNIVAENTDVPVPRILFYDDSCTLLDRPYFFMEKLEGTSFSSSMDELQEEQRTQIYASMGTYTRMLNQITGTNFGYYCQYDKQGSDWYEIFKSMMSDLYFDAARKNILIPVSKEDLFGLLEQDKIYFEPVKTPKLVHWDIWAGNVFIKDGTVTGIIDFERCLWADELMEVGFRTYGYEKAFFDGYGKRALTPEEQKRARWYDIYLFLIWCIEGDYRQYDSRKLYEYGCEMLMKWVGELR